MSQLSFDFNAVTALGPDDPDDGDEGRQRRGMAIAALVRVEKNRLGYKVPSQSGKGSYVVNTDDTPFCTCPDFERRQLPCKHVYAVKPFNGATAFRRWKLSLSTARITQGRWDLRSTGPISASIPPQLRRRPGGLHSHA